MQQVSTHFWVLYEQFTIFRGRLQGDLLDGFDLFVEQPSVHFPDDSSVKDHHNPIYAETLIVVDLMVVNCFSCSTLLETVFSFFDHLWTQDSPISPLTFGGKTGPNIDQGGSTLKV